MLTAPQLKAALEFYSITSHDIRDVLYCHTDINGFQRTIMFHEVAEDALNRIMQLERETLLIYTDPSLKAHLDEIKRRHGRV